MLIKTKVRRDMDRITLKNILGFINNENGNSGHHNNQRTNGQGQFGGQYNGQGAYDGQYSGQYSGQAPYNRPKSGRKRATVDFRCLNVGEETSNAAVDINGCAHVFDTIETANLACSLFEKCLLIGQNRDGNFELFTESDDNVVADLENYNLSIPTMDKTQTSLFYGDFDNIILTLFKKVF